MRAFRRALGFELTPGGWRAVHLEARLFGLGVLGCAEGRLEPQEPDESPQGALKPGAVAAALAEAVQALNVRPGTRLGVALTRPLAHVKRMALPRATRPRILETVRTQAPALFPVGRRAVLADVRVLRRNGWRARGATTEGQVAAAPEQVLEALANAAHESDLVLESADLSAGSVRSLLARSIRRIFLSHDAGLERVAYGHRRSIDSSRYFPWAADDATGKPTLETHVAREGPGSGSQLALVAGLPAEVRDEILTQHVPILGTDNGFQAIGREADERRPLRDADDGQTVTEADSRHSAREADADDAAYTESSREGDDRHPGEAGYTRSSRNGLFRGAARGLPDPQRARFAAACGAACQALGARPLFDLRPERLRFTRDRRRARRRGVLLGVLVLSVAVYGLVGFFRLRADVEALERQVAALEPRVEEVLAVQAAVTAAAGRAELLARLEAAQPRWTSVLAELARVLPRETYLSSLTERDGRLRLEGYAAATSGVVSALQSSGMFDSVRLAGPVTPEQTPQGVRDRFAIELVVTHGRRSP